MVSNFPHGVRSQILLVAFADVQRQLFFTRTFGVYAGTWWKTLNIVCLSSRLPCLHAESRPNVC